MNTIIKPLEEVLTREEAAFVRMINLYPGAKLQDAYSQDGTALWERPEQLGLIKCVGSYKWVPGDNLMLGVRV